MAAKRPILILGTLLACEGPIVQQMGEDHFPLKSGNYWCYEDTANYITRIEVTGQAAMGGRWAWVVEEDYKPSYWLSQAGEIRYFTAYEDTLGGEVHRLGETYRLLYRVPFVDNAAWNEDYKIDTIIQGETIRLQDELEGMVVGIEELKLPAGDSSAAYKVRIIETFIFNGSTTVDTSYRWFAPGVGMVKRDDAVLVEYSIR